jgi:hypothetical protein
MPLIFELGFVALASLASLALLAYVSILLERAFPDLPAVWGFNLLLELPRWATMLMWHYLMWMRNPNQRLMRNLFTIRVLVTAAAIASFISLPQIASAEHFLLHPKNNTYKINIEIIFPYSRLECDYDEDRMYWLHGPPYQRCRCINATTVFSTTTFKLKCNAIYVFRETIQLANVTIEEQKKEPGIYEEEYQWIMGDVELSTTIDKKHIIMKDVENKTTGHGQFSYYVSLTDTNAKVFRYESKVDFVLRTKFTRYQYVTDLANVTYFDGAFKINANPVKYMRYKNKTAQVTPKSVRVHKKRSFIDNFAPRIIDYDDVANGAGAVLPNIMIIAPLIYHVAK